MKFVTDYLRDIDNEAMRIRQQIATLQVRLQQLADMRVLMMGREEERAVAAGQPSPFGTFPAGAEVAVRDPLTYRPAAAAAIAALPSAHFETPEEADKAERKRVRDQAAYQRRKHRLKRERQAAVAREYGAGSNGHALDTLIEANGTERKERSDKGKAKPGEGRHRARMDAVHRIFLDRPSMPLMTKEVMDRVFPDRIPLSNEKQQVYQALYELRKQGLLHQSRPGEPYTLVASP